jgi:hypothetical protein
MPSLWMFIFFALAAKKTNQKKSSSQSECFPRSLPVLNAFSGCLALLALREKAKPAFPPTLARPL